MFLITGTFPIAKAFLEAGFHVMCEKPMTMSVAEAKKLKEIVKKNQAGVWSYA